MFQEVLSRLLTEKGITAMELSREIGVPKTVVYEWKKGIREPNAENLRRLSRFFGVSVSSLLEQNEGGEEEILILLRKSKSLSPEKREQMLNEIKAGMARYLGEEE